MGVLTAPFYVVSDTHFGHRNIARYAGRPHDHETIMVKRWQRAVRETDVILHLGDLFFGGDEGYEHFRNEISPKLPGKKFLILGNHDKRRWDYAPLGFEVIKPFKMKYRGYVVSFDHYPKLLHQEELDNAKVVHVHGHIHNNSYARGEEERWGNVNVSVEVMNYRPHRISRLLNNEIRRRNQRGKRYHNSRHYRYHSRRRAAR